MLLDRASPAGLAAAHCLPFLCRLQHMAHFSSGESVLAEPSRLGLTIIIEAD
jgi:hypothetical protein